MEVTDKEMIPMIRNHTLYSLIKDPTCFFTQQGRCIDLMLTNSKHSFMNCKTFDTGESDFHHMIYTMFKTTFTKLPPKKIKYRCYKMFDKLAFRSDLVKNLRLCSFSSDYNLLESTFQQTLDQHAPYKVKVLRGNNKPFITKDMRKAIAVRSKLKNIARSTNDPTDIKLYKNQEIV